MRLSQRLIADQAVEGSVVGGRIMSGVQEVARARQASDSAAQVGRHPTKKQVPGCTAGQQPLALGNRNISATETQNRTFCSTESAQADSKCQCLNPHVTAIPKKISHLRRSESEAFDLRAAICVKKAASPAATAPPVIVGPIVYTSMHTPVAANMVRDMFVHHYSHPLSQPTEIYNRTKPSKVMKRRS